MRRPASTAAVLLSVLAFAAPALADNAGLTPIEPRSPNADAINISFYLVLAITGAIFVLVEGALILFLVKYRRRARTRHDEGPQIHGHTRLELLWTAVPILLIAIIVSFVFYKLPEIEPIPEAQAGTDGNIEIEVEGRQFYWQFRYPDGSITYDTLIVPVDRTIELRVTAPEHDVIHSWWIPALGGKMDAIPGIENRTWFRAEREGEYGGRCTEFCGLQHGAMTATVRAVSADEFESEVASFTGRRLGEQTFEAVCAKCHNVAGPQLIGPTLRGNPILADREALAELVQNGVRAMPAVGRGWSDEQIDALLAYTRPIGGGSGG